ncbi:MAG: hemolysin family protein [Propionibacteriales bacterium]|nr:hemolysin family protein [Propionibacteriales bacterium]
MNPTVRDALLIALFVVVGGVFAAAEMALVSLRDSQVKQLSARGRRGRTVAELSASPNRFLSAVQIGVTLAGFLSAAYGGATLADTFSQVLIGWGVPVDVAPGLALFAVTLVISYFSIVLGELAAKRLAMQRAESFALALAPLVSAIAWLATPLIWFLGKSTDVVVRLLGGDPNASREEVTDSELRALVGSSATLGDEERQIVDEVFGAGDVSLRETMVPRTEVDFLDGELSAGEAFRQVHEGSHSRYPVIGEDADDVLGFVHIRDLAVLSPAARKQPVSRLVRPVLSLPQSMRILRALSQMRQGHHHLAIVSDEYGGTAGIVTIEDLVEELIGDITDEFDDETPRTEGQAEVDGLVTLEDFASDYGYVLPEGPYDTVAGFVMAQLGSLPRLGDVCAVTLAATEEGHAAARFELAVTELDGRRAARLRLTRVDAESGEPSSEPASAGEVS